LSSIIVSIDVGSAGVVRESSTREAEGECPPVVRSEEDHATDNAQRMHLRTG
jgi:hypothetical protein